MKGFQPTGQGRVRSDWIDRNAHMTMARYLDVFDAACEVLLERSGLAREDGDSSFVAGRVRLAHRRELLEGDPFEVISGFISVGTGSVTFAHRLLSGGTIRATCEIYSTPFSIERRASIALIDAEVDGAREFVVPGLRDPFASS